MAQAVASLSKGEFKLSYLLLPAQGIRQNLHRNPKLSGASLSGVVLDRDKDRVRLHLEVDPEQKKEEACWFPYASAYTAEGNSGWYFMPEVGIGPAVLPTPPRSMAGHRRSAPGRER